MEKLLFSEDDDFLYYDENESPLKDDWNNYKYSSNKRQSWAIVNQAKANTEFIALHNKDVERIKGRIVNPFLSPLYHTLSKEREFKKIFLWDNHNIPYVQENEVQFPNLVWETDPENINLITRPYKIDFGRYWSSRAIKKSKFLRKQKYISEELFYGKIVEVTNEFVVVDLLIDMESKSFEKRGFPIEPIKALKLNTVGLILQIEVKVAAGKLCYQFSEADSNKFPAIEKSDFFNRITETSLFKSLQDKANESNF